MQSYLEAKQVLRWLIIVRWASLVDLLLLVVLLSASFAGNEELGVGKSELGLVVVQLKCYRMGQ